MPDQNGKPSVYDCGAAWSERDLDASLERLARTQSEFALLAPGGRTLATSGYSHTLREICQQPLTWPATAACAAQLAPEIAAFVADCRLVVLTGSGSSVYAAECVAPAVQQALGVPAVAVSGGNLLTEGMRAWPPLRPAVFVWFARSGDSPESHGPLELLLETEPAGRHLVITCNPRGRLAQIGPGDRRVRVVELDPRTCDESLVMTSSFTNMVVAVLGLLAGADPKTAGVLARIADSLLLEHVDAVAELARRPFHSAVFLGSGARYGAARETSLKLQEMTAGRIGGFPETYLGLRHGPMSSIHDDTLVGCFLSSDPLRRAYEIDLIDELNRKELGLAKVIVGESIPHNLLRPGDLALECAGLSAAGDDAATVIDAMTGQLLGFFRCLFEGLSPDAPSEKGVINRVVGSFTLHRTGAGAGR